MRAAVVLRRIISALERAGIAYMLTGSFASAHYGVPRSTQDIDMVIAAETEQLRSFVQSLPTDQYYAELSAALEAQTRQSLFNVIDLKTGWKVDLIIRKSRPFSHEEFSRRRLVMAQGLQLYVASAEDIVIAKLEWAQLSQSRRQIEDAAAVLKLRWESLDRSYVESWVSELHLHPEWADAKRVAGIPEVHKPRL